MAPKTITVIMANSPQLKPTGKPVEAYTQYEDAKERQRRLIAYDNSPTTYSLHTLILDEYLLNSYVVTFNTFENKWNALEHEEFQMTKTYEGDYQIASNWTWVFEPVHGYTKSEAINKCKQLLSDRFKEAISHNP